MEEEKKPAKRNPIDNLKAFTPEKAREAQRLGVQKRKENNFYRQAAAQQLEKILNRGALEDLTRNFKKLKKSEQVMILEHLGNFSGFKPKEETPTVVMPVININGL